MAAGRADLVVASARLATRKELNFILPDSEAKIIAWLAGRPKSNWAHSLIYFSLSAMFSMAHDLQDQQSLKLIKHV